MIAPGSRYEEAEQQFTEKHLYDRYGYPMLENRDNVPRFMLQRQNTTYLLVTLPLPPPPPVEYLAKDTEHFPFIAFKFMDDSTRWWEIAEVNPDIWYPLDLTAGDFLRIPS